MKKLLFTGGTGFLGTNVKPILDKTYEVTTIGITDRDMLKANLVVGVPELPEHYDVVLHAAGKAHIYPKTEAEIKAFYDVNYEGTVNLCAALENVGVPKSFIFISTLDVYGLAAGEGIDESYPCHPTTHYAISKLQAEEYLIKWAEAKGVTLGILRPSLMTGPNPPGNLKAMINGIKKGYYVNISGGHTRKSLMMIYDIAHVVPKIENIGGTYNLCDNRHPSYYELSKCIGKQLGKKHDCLNIPYWMALYMAKIGDLVSVLPIDSHRLEQLTKSNTYSNEKAKKKLNWEPMDVIESFKIK